MISFSFSHLPIYPDTPDPTDTPADRHIPETLIETRSADVAAPPNKPRFRKTTVDDLETILKEITTKLDGTKGRWMLTFEDVSLAVVVDEHHDRMRIIAPVVEVEKITADHYRKMLEANFHTALDTRYAIANDIVYAAFIHPLSALHDTEFASALMQVANLAKTFGTTYSSGELQYQDSTKKY